MCVTMTHCVCHCFTVWHCVSLCQLYGFIGIIFLTGSLTYDRFHWSQTVSIRVIDYSSILLQWLSLTSLHDCVIMPVSLSMYFNLSLCPCIIMSLSLCRSWSRRGISASCVSFWRVSSFIWQKKKTMNSLRRMQMPSGGDWWDNTY